MWRPCFFQLSSLQLSLFCKDAELQIFYLLYFPYSGPCSVLVLACGISCHMILFGDIFYQIWSCWISMFSILTFRKVEASVFQGYKVDILSLFSFAASPIGIILCFDLCFFGAHSYSDRYPFYGISCLYFLSDILGLNSRHVNSRPFYQARLLVAVIFLVGSRGSELSMAFSTSFSMILSLGPFWYDLYITL